MLKRLGRVAREARVDAERTQLDIATAAGVSHVVISNLERGDRWPQSIDRLVAAYETECGLPCDELWRRAVLQTPT